MIEILGQLVSRLSGSRLIGWRNSRVPQDSQACQKRGNDNVCLFEAANFERFLGFGQKALKSGDLTLLALHKGPVVDDAILQALEFPVLGSRAEDLGPLNPSCKTHSTALSKAALLTLAESGHQGLLQI
jgi:hypothetical protein